MHLCRILFLLLLPTVLNAQQLSYYNYTIEDGLSSNEVYALHEDSEGYIWMGTDHGVCRYNGYEFVTYTAHDGLPGNTIFNFYSDHKGRVWFYSFNGEIGFYFKNKLYTIDIPEKYDDLIDGIFVSNNDEVTITYMSSGTIEFSLNRNQLVVNSVQKRDGFYQLINGELIIKGHHSSVRDSSSLQEIIQNDRPFYNDSKTHCVKIGTNRYAVVSTGQNSGLIVDSSRNVIHKLERGGENSRFTGMGSTPSYWYTCTSESKLLKYHYNQFQEPFERVDLGNYIPTCVLIDGFNGMWISTLNKGVLYIPNKEIKVTRINPDVVGNGLVHFSKNEFIEFFVNKNNELHRLSLKKDKQFPVIESKIRFEKLHSYDTSFLLFTRQNLFLFDQLGNRRGAVADKYRNAFIHRGLTSLLVTKNGDVIGSGSSQDGSIIINGEKFDYPKLRRPVAMVEEGDTIWVGDFNGLFAFSLSERKPLKYKKHELLNTRVSNLKRLGKVLIIGTRGEGVLLKRGNEVVQITELDGLSNNSITCIETDGKNTIWIGGNSGITKITLNSVTPIKYSLQTFGKEDGLLAREIRDLQLFQDTLRVLTENSIYQLHKDYQFNKTQPKLYIKSVFVNDRAIDLSKSIELDYTQNNIEFEFEALYFKNSSALIYNYSLDDGETWRETKNRSVAFKDLSPGVYSFKIRAITPNGELSEIKQLRFTITPPFWQTWPFYLLVVLLSALIIFGIVKLYVKQIRMKNKILESELKALRSMMNPHFTFNTINSIQHFIVQKDTKGALAFTSKFAGLIRMILNNSSSEFITIQKELDALQLYLEIEQLRLDKKFTYQINVASSINKEFDKIPSMIIQPYVENSLWHGIMNKEGEGTIKIEINRTASGIFCCVEDDGVGREKANSYKSGLKTKHKSLGMSLTNERLKLIKQSSGRKMEVKVVDLFNEKNNAIGTRVEIKIENPK